MSVSSFSLLSTIKWFDVSSTVVVPLKIGLFKIVFARIANRRVDSVWLKLHTAGDTQQIIDVKELPPSAYCRILVSFESRYGMCCFFPSASLLMQFAKLKRLLLINPVSPNPI